MNNKLNLLTPKIRILNQPMNGRKLDLTSTIFVVIYFYLGSLHIKLSTHFFEKIVIIDLTDIYCNFDVKNCIVFVLNY